MFEFARKFDACRRVDERLAWLTRNSDNKRVANHNSVWACGAGAGCSDRTCPGCGRAIRRRSRDEPNASHAAFHNCKSRLFTNHWHLVRHWNRICFLPMAVKSNAAYRRRRVGGPILRHFGHDGVTSVKAHGRRDAACPKPWVLRIHERSDAAADVLLAANYQITNLRPKTLIHGDPQDDR
jgi:hypothetical protein